METYIEYVRSFNHGIKTLAVDMYQRYPNDTMVYHAKRRVVTVVEIDPLYVINEAGPYLYKYRDTIYALERTGEAGKKAESFFLQNTYDEEMQNADDAELADMSGYVIPLVKKSINGMPDNERYHYKKLVVALLDDYVDYLAARYPRSNKK